MSEKETTLSPEDRAALDRDNRDKTDLSKDADHRVPTGKEAVPDDKIDPFQARKSIYKKAHKVRDTRLKEERSQHEDVDAIAKAYETEADGPGSKNEMDRGEHFDTERRRGRYETVEEFQERMAAQLADESGDGENGEGEDVEPRHEAAPAKGSTELDNLPERVTVKVLGQEYEVPRQDIIDAGGVSAYQKDRAASIRLQQAAEREAAVKADRERLAKERAEFEQQRASAGRVAPATAPVGTPGAAPTPPGGVGSSADVEAEAERLVEDIYSGDPKKAREAIRKVIGLHSKPVSTMDPAEIARQAAEMLRAQAPAPAAPAPTERTVDPKEQVEIEELNAMMAEQFSEVLENAALRKQALSKFQELRADPANRYRRLVDMGREAARATLKQDPHPRAAVKERKRDLPALPSGHRAAPGEPEYTPMKGSDVVAKLRAARGQV